MHSQSFQSISRLRTPFALFTIVVSVICLSSVASPESPRATVLAQEAELQDGDLLVGVHDGRGAIIRIRAGQAITYCESQQNHHEPMYFDTPKEIVIDRHGDVIFLAHLSTPTGLASLGPFGLWRCDHLGAVPELLGAFGSDPAFDHPRPLGDRPVRWAGGLHIKRSAGVNLDRGEAATTESIVFAVADGGSEHRDTIAFYPDVGSWSEFGNSDDPFQGGGYSQFDMINGGSGIDNFTISSAGNGMKVVNEPVAVEFEIAGFLQAKLAFQRVQELVGAEVDDLTVGNADSHECLIPLPGTPRNIAGTINGMTGINALGWVDGEGLVMQSDSFGMGHAFIPKINMALFNIMPDDDNEARYVRPSDCAIRPKLPFRPWHAFNSYNDPSGLPREVDVLAPGGGAGTQTFDGRVVRVGQGDNVTVLASGLNAAPFVTPMGIDVYPGYRPTVAGLSVFIRIDSPVDVLITDASGRRIGVDPATGEHVNDFGDAGFDSETAEPHIYGIRQPSPGGYRIDTIGTGTGPYTVTAFGVNLGTSAVTRTAFTGTAAPGSQSDHEFDLDEQGVVTVETPVDTEPPSIAVHADISAAPTSSAGATVPFTPPTATDNSGVVSVACAPASGSLFPIGTTTVVCTATDGSDNTSQTDFDVIVGCCTATLRVSHPSVQQGDEVTLIGRARTFTRAPETVSFTFDVVSPIAVPIGTAAATFGHGPYRRVSVPLHVGADWPTGTYAIRMRMTSADGVVERLGQLQVTPRKTHVKAGGASRP